MQTTTSTVTQSSVNVNTAIRYDPLYMKTIPGILKCVCIVSKFKSTETCIRVESEFFILK